MARSSARRLALAISALLLPPSFPRRVASFHGLKHRKKQAARVAVVFAGSPRSFIFPRIHWSIKANLINALADRVDVFARVSTQDNIHGDGIGAEGITLNTGNASVLECSHSPVTSPAMKVIIQERGRLQP
jgi:hypothetical protein